MVAVRLFVVNGQVIRTIPGIETLAVDALVWMCSWLVRQASEPAEVTDCLQSGTAALRFVPTESGSPHSSSTLCQPKALGYAVHTLLLSLSI
jgi:hypothetical protein